MSKGGGGGGLSRKLLKIEKGLTAPLLVIISTYGMSSRLCSSLGDWRKHVFTPLGATPMYQQDPKSGL